MRKILCLHDEISAANTYRLHRFLDHIPNKVVKQDYLNKKRRTVGEIAENLKKKGDIWIAKYLPNDQDPKRNMIATLLSCKRIAGTKLVIDLDDNIWKIPLGNPTFWAFRENKGALNYLISEADQVTCSTEPLALAIKPYNKNVTVFKNLIDPSDWTLTPRKANKKVRIGWIFSVTHMGDIRPIESALKEIMEEFKDKVEFVLIGGAKGLFDFDYTFTEGVKFEDYAKRLEEINLDISIAPLATNEFNAAKSNIKWLESSMAGAAFIGSKVYPYENSIKNGKTGFVAGSPNQWKNSLRKLIESKELREKLVENARKEILKDYNIENETEYSNFIESL